MLLYHRLPQKFSGLKQQLFFIVLVNSVKSGVPAGHGKVIVSLFVVSNVTQWYSTGIWAGLEGPKWLHSHVYCLGGECWKVGLSQDSRSERASEGIDISCMIVSEVVVVQSLSCVQFFVTPWTTAHQAFPSFTLSQSVLKLRSTDSVMPSTHLILCHPLLLLSSVFPISVFSNESALHIRWSKYWSFSFSISPYSEYLGLISFSMDWFDLLAVQGTLKSLFHHHSLKAILWCSAFFMVQLSYQYICTFWESLGNHIASLPLYLPITRFCYILFVASTDQKEGNWTTFWKGEWQGHIVKEACRTGYLGTSIFGK